jgi:hypothetical protein
LQEETKEDTRSQGETKKKVILEITKEYITLPVLEEEPVFMGQPLIIIEDATGKTILNPIPAFALIASLTLTVKDVYKFAEQLDLGAGFDVPGEQMLQMVDSRFSDTRAIYKLAILTFIHETLPKTYMTELCIPAAHLATVLLQLYKDREALWKSCVKGKPAKTLNADKETAPALVVDALKQGAFLARGLEKQVVSDEDRTFLVAFPGYDVRQVPSTRSNGIIAAVKNKKIYADQCMKMSE